MDVLVVGSTGVIGQPSVRRLVADGHHVRALVRRTSGPASLGPEAAVAVEGDLLDRASLDAAVAGCDAVVNVASAIPRGSAAPGAWDLNDRVRTEGTRNLLQAMDAHGVPRLVHASVYLVYGNDRGDELLDEGADLQPPEVVVTAVEGERLVRASSLDWTILRPGWLYGAASWHAQQLIGDLRAGRTRVVEGAPAWRSPVAAEDVAAAISLSLSKQGAAGLTFNVASSPIRWPDLVDGLSRHLGAPTPRRLTSDEAADLPGPEYAALTRSVRMDSSRAGQRLGFSPQWPDARQGLAAIAEQEQ